MSGVYASRVGLDTRSPQRRSRWVDSWWVDLGLVAGFAAFTSALAGGAFLGVDVAVYEWTDAHLPPAAYWTARVFNMVGQGSPLAALTLAVAGWLAWKRRSVRPLAAFVAVYLAAMAVIGSIKVFTDRAAPHNTTLAHPELLFNDPGGMSYISGHVANAVIWYGLLALLLRAYLGPVQYAVLRLAPPAISVITNTYLGFHWLSDSIGALLIAVWLDRMIHRVPWDDLPFGRRLTQAGWAGRAFDR